MCRKKETGYYETEYQHIMLKSCKYCGRIHDSKFNCRKKPVRRKIKYTESDKFRRTQKWTDKAVEIKCRDNYLCQACIRELHGTIRKYNHKRLSVHHAIPICDDWDRRLDDDNLITLCSMHHEMAESGEISYEEIKKIIDEQQAKRKDA
ncbi:HNH endonuclease [Hominisplanchenecus murintestinalis]|nr:HNH endonuclease [Hominisplanchenecus murintestinalis]